MNTIRICFANKVEKKNVLHREIREPKLNAFIDRHASAEAGTWIYLWSQQNTETAMNIATAWHRLNKKKNGDADFSWFFYTLLFLYAQILAWIQQKQRKNVILFTLTFWLKFPFFVRF